MYPSTIVCWKPFPKVFHKTIKCDHCYVWYGIIITFWQTAKYMVLLCNPIPTHCFISVAFNFLWTNKYSGKMFMFLAWICYHKNVKWCAKQMWLKYTLKQKTRPLFSRTFKEYSLWILIRHDLIQFSWQQKLAIPKRKQIYI